MSFLLKVIHGKIYPPADTRPSFAGRNIVVTGANSGLGFAAALKLVQCGAARVILAVRSLEKGEVARAAIAAQTGRADVAEVWQLDMLDYDSVRAFAARAAAELTPTGGLHYAVLNAGVMMKQFATSKYGWERTLQVNVLSTTLLALLLLPVMGATRTADFTPMLEIVGSMNHYVFNDVLPGAREAAAPLEIYNKPENYSFIWQYSVSKLFIMYVQTGLIETVPSLAKENPSIHLVVVCPGACDSDIDRDLAAWYLAPLKVIARNFLQRTSEQGSRTYVSGLTLGERGHGRFWQSDEVQQPAKMLIGEENAVLQQKVWENVLAALRKDVPEIDSLLAQ